LVPSLTIGELQNRNRNAFLNFFGLGPGPGNDKRELPYAGQLPSDAFPLKDPALTRGDVWRPTASEKAMAGAYGYGSAVADIKPAADNSKASLDALNSTFRPEVDTSSLQSAMQLAQALFDQLARVGAAAGALPGTMRMASVPSLGATRRGSFITAWPGD
jgi:hypothetical protein